METVYRVGFLYISTVQISGCISRVSQYVGGGLPNLSKKVRIHNVTQLFAFAGRGGSMGIRIVVEQGDGFLYTTGGTRCPPLFFLMLFSFSFSFMYLENVAGLMFIPYSFSFSAISLVLNPRFLMR